MRECTFTLQGIEYRCSAVITEMSISRVITVSVDMPQQWLSPIHYVNIAFDPPLPALEPGWTFQIAFVNPG